MVDEVKAVAEAAVTKAEAAVATVKTDVKAEVAVVTSKFRAFVSKYSIPSVGTVAGYVGGHYKVLTAVVAVVKHFL